jgi:hypothetical protein
MAGPVYMLSIWNVSDAWYQLSEEERASHNAKTEETLKKAGGKAIINCFSGWSDIQWGAFTVEEFPDAEAVQQYIQDLFRIDHFRYYPGESLLGIKFEEESS